MINSLLKCRSEGSLTRQPEDIRFHKFTDLYDYTTMAGSPVTSSLPRRLIAEVAWSWARSYGNTGLSCKTGAKRAMKVSGSCALTNRNVQKSHRTSTVWVAERSKNPFSWKPISLGLAERLNSTLHGQLQRSMVTLVVDRRESGGLSPLSDTHSLVNMYQYVCVRFRYNTNLTTVLFLKRIDDSGLLSN